MKIAVSGGFDPVHIGHVRMFEEAKKLGDLQIYLNSDDFLIEKKGKAFMPYKEREEILEAWGEVLPVIDADQTVCESLKLYKPDIFANGGDRTTDNVPEQAVCEELGIKMVWGVGGGKIQSSSELLNKYNT